MIKRITNPEEFELVINDIYKLFLEDDEKNAHVLGLKHNKETIINSFGTSKLLAFDVFVWANKTENVYDSVGIFILSNNVKFGIKFLSEFLWLSKNPKAGFKILKEATALAREKGVEYITISSVNNHPKHERNERFYEKLGFVKDSTTFIAKL